MWRRRWHPTPVLLPGKSHGRRSLVGCSPWGHEESDTTERLPFHFSLMKVKRKEKEMVTHSSVLAWRIPGTGDLGGLPSMGLHRVGHDWSDLAAAAAAWTMLNTLIVWTTTNCGKFFKRWEYQATWPASCKTCMHEEATVRIGHGTTD